LQHLYQAIAHIKAGAKKVLLTGPSKGGDVQMIVKGVNNDQLDIEKYDIFSNAFGYQIDHLIPLQPDRYSL
jgi:glyceraldehyde 3-phosphate dehydrogenase